MRTASLIAVSVLLAAFPAHAQSPRDIITAQLDEGVTIAAGQGYRPTQGMFEGGKLIGVLPAGGSVYLEVQLRAGVDYMVLGVCDADCTDLDLRATSSSWYTIAEDVEMDDVPVLVFRSPDSGPHMIQVMLPSCSTATCFFGLRFFNN